MSLEDFAVTLDELTGAINTFVKSQCEKKDNHLEHKGCGGAIRTGFLNLFYLTEHGGLDPGFDGFGIGPKRVPYCERCFPPDGFNYTYAVRFPILKERKMPPAKDYEFAWGNRFMSQNQGLLPE